MDLWIRSQDKRKLVKSGYLTIFLSDTNWFIYSDTATGEPFEIGKYKTEERALEVLDEINEHIEKQGQTIAITNEKGIVDGLKYYGKTYVMPEV